VTEPLDEEEADPGLQAERTSLAWLRTALSCAGLAGLTANLVETGDARIAAVVAGLLVGTAGLLAAWYRSHALTDDTPGAAPLACGALLAGAVAGADVIAIVLLVS
jgi:putative membrane protein